MSMSTSDELEVSFMWICRFSLIHRRAVVKEKKGHMEEWLPLKNSSATNFEPLDRKRRASTYLLSLLLSYSALYEH